MREEPRNPAVQHRQEPLAGPAGTGGRMRRQCTKCQRDRRAQSEQNRNDHRQRHVLQHVCAEQCPAVCRQPAVEHERDDGESGQPGESAPDRPVQSSPRQRSHAGDVQGKRCPEASSTRVSGRQPVRTSPSEYGGRSKPNTACAAETWVAGTSGTGVGVRDSATARPTVAAITTTTSGQPQERPRPSAMPPPEDAERDEGGDLPEDEESVPLLHSWSTAPSRTQALTSPEKPIAT